VQGLRGKEDRNAAGAGEQLTGQRVETGVQTVVLDYVRVYRSVSSDGIDFATTEWSVSDVKTSAACRFSGRMNYVTGSAAVLHASVTDESQAFHEDSPCVRIEGLLQGNKNTAYGFQVGAHQHWH
jgi:hypothetical protein